MSRCTDLVKGNVISSHMRSGCATSAVTNPGMALGVYISKGTTMFSVLLNSTDPESN